MDLLVREAIQNSSDASLSQPGPVFAVNFTARTFCPAKFNSYLTDIEDYFPTDSPGTIMLKPMISSELSIFSRVFVSDRY